MLKTQIKDSLLILELDDQESYNAFSPAMAAEFHKQLQENTYKAVYLTSNGHKSIFCSGGNLSFYKNLETRDEGLEHNDKIRFILNEFKSLKVPKVCYVNGTVLGGGIELISCFDRILASPHSLFGLWQRRIGLTYGWGGEKRLLQRISKSKLEQWLFQASTKSVYEAKEIGLVDEICLSNQAIAASNRWIDNVCSQGIESFEKIKSHEDPSKAFQALWLSEKHKKVLKKF